MKLLSWVESYQPIEVEKKTRNKEIRSNPPIPVRSFSELTRIIGNLSFRKRESVLYYRGQHREYVDDRQLPTIYPSIYRRIDRSTRKKELDKRFKTLEVAEVLLKTECKTISGYKKIDGFEELLSHRPIQWALLQHYKVCDTPVLDITASLRVAASFALDEHNSTQKGILYVLGMPYTNDAISFYYGEELYNIKLTSLCPPSALRPYVQDGYLSGTFKFGTTHNPQFEMNDFSRRLIAKLELDNSTGRFWSESFPFIPSDILLPEQDEFFDICKRVRANLARVIGDDD